MRIEQRGFVFDMGTAVLSIYDQDAFLGVQIDAYGEDDSGVEPFELHSPFGFLSRPDDPDSSGLGCQVLYAYAGSQPHAWLSHDPRYVPLVPPLKKGGSAQYCKTGAFGSFDGKDGSYTLYVPYAFSGTTPSKASVITVDVSQPGQEAITLVHGAGMMISMVAGGTNAVVLKNKAGDAYIQVDDTGVTINGNVNINGFALMGKQLIALLTLIGANTKPPTPVPPTPLSVF